VSPRLGAPGAANTAQRLAWQSQKIMPLLMDG
jgi:hypothetical protein